jgi:hypothetical protein
LKKINPLEIKKLISNVFSLYFVSNTFDFTAHPILFLILVAHILFKKRCYISYSIWLINGIQIKFKSHQSNGPNKRGNKGAINNVENSSQCQWWRWYGSVVTRFECKLKMLTQQICKLPHFCSKTKTHGSAFSLILASHSSSMTSLSLISLTFFRFFCLFPS